MTLASTAVFGYAGLVPAVLYGYLWWVGRGGALAVSFLELVRSLSLSSLPISISGLYGYLWWDGRGSALAISFLELVRSLSLLDLSLSLVSMVISGGMAGAVL